MILIALCIRATKSKGGIIHHGKMDFFQIILRRGVPTLHEAPVEEFDTVTSKAAPIVVGVPVMHQLGFGDKLTRIVSKMRKLKAKYGRDEVSVPLALRAFASFGLASLDYVLAGVFVPPEVLTEAAGVVTSTYRKILGYPSWMWTALQQLPLHAGGMGVPDLPLRGRLLLLKTYLMASLSRNVLARKAAAFQLITSDPQAEGSCLRRALRSEDIEVYSTSDGSLTAAKLHLEGDLKRCWDFEELLLVPDGSQTGTRVGAGFLLWHPDAGILLRGWMGVEVLAGHSTDGEWLARLLGVYVLDGWKGRLLTIPDSTSALTKGSTAAPRRQTVLAVLYRALRPPQYPSMRLEFWLPAQHDTQSAEVVALLNKEADILARRGAQCAIPLTVPLLHLLPHRVIASRGGAVLLDPRAVEKVYSTVKQRNWTEVAPMTVFPVSATYFVEHVLQGTFTPAEVRRTCSHRSLSLRGVPPEVSMLECYFCGAMTWNLQDHVFVGCPSHFLAVQEAMYRALQVATVTAKGHLRGHGNYWSEDGQYSLRIGHDLEVWTAPSLDPGTHQLVSTTGVWRTWSTEEGAVGQSAATRRLITKAVVRAMCRH